MIGQRKVCFPIDLNTNLNWPQIVKPRGYITTASDEQTVEILHIV